MFQQRFDAAELAYELRGRLLANTRTAGYVVGGVTHEAQDVNDLTWTIDVPLLTYFDLTKTLEVTLRAGTQHADMLRDELAIVLVWREHYGVYALTASSRGQCADDIICLKACDLDDRYVVGV